MNPKNWIEDERNTSETTSITPYRKPAGGELLDWQKEYNTQVNRIRWMIEQVIFSHFKNWTIMHTDYPQPLRHQSDDRLSGSWPSLLQGGLNNPQGQLSSFDFFFEVTRPVPC